VKQFFKERVAQLKNLRVYLALKQRMFWDFDLGCAETA
jgi:hypothetical protein